MFYRFISFMVTQPLKRLGHPLVGVSLLSRILLFIIYKTIILPVVLYGCETWSLKLREECRLRVFENRIVMRIFGPKRDANG